MPPTPDESRPFSADGLPDPEAEYAFQSQADRVAEEKRQALAAPDVPWRVWWLHSGSKWYIIVGFLIADVWLLSLGFQLGVPAVFIPVIVVAVYLEYLLYEYLWYIPSYEEPRERGPFHRTWVHPVEFGRWTAQGDALRAGGAVTPPEGPDPKDFL